MSRAEHEEQLLAKLPYAKNAAFNHYDRQGDSLCMQNTRTAVLREIMAWARGKPGSTVDNGGGSDGQPHKRVYWLNGMAGTGKSTIARTVARRCHDDGRLGASFFFSRGGGELETARMFVTTIAVQLARRSGRLRTLVGNAVAANPDIVAETLSDQWKAPVLRSCEEVGAGGATADRLAAPMVIVIDALDECSNEREVTFVLQLLSDMSAFVVPCLQIVTVAVGFGLHFLSWCCVELGLPTCGRTPSPQLGFRLGRAKIPIKSSSAAGTPRSEMAARSPSAMLAPGIICNILLAARREIEPLYNFGLGLRRITARQG